MASTARRGEQPAGRQLRSTPQRHRGRVVSHTPGRVRIRLDAVHRQTAVLGHLAQGLVGQDGVSAVSVNARPGSVLVHYDHRRLMFDALLDTCHDLGLILHDVAEGGEIDTEDVAQPVGVAPEVGHSSTAVTVMDALTDLDRRLSRLTGGKLDVKLLFPVCLGVLGVRQIAMSGLGLAEVPAYVLLWYAFDSFYKLHQRRTAQLVEAVPAGPMGAQGGAGAPLDDALLVDETGD
jgi:hypothetical protein